MIGTKKPNARSLNKMKIRDSFKDDVASLYVVSTPIGNLGDITLRAIDTLKRVDLIYAEDTRNTRKLLTHFEIKTLLDTYHEHNKGEKKETILNQLRQGKSIAIVTDAGTPAISDPGYELVFHVKNEFPVVVVPGASAILTALVGSGLVVQPFTFYGFLNRAKQKREKELTQLRVLPHTLVFYESPNRIKDTLKALLDVFGNRHVCLARELTKHYESYIEGNLLELIEADLVEKGEFVIICEGYQKIEEEITSPRDKVLEYIELGYDHKEAIKMVAKEMGVNKNIVYQEVINQGGIKTK